MNNTKQSLINTIKSAINEGKINQHDILFKEETTYYYRYNNRKYELIIPHDTRITEVVKGTNSIIVRFSKHITITRLGDMMVSFNQYLTLSANELPIKILRMILDNNEITKLNAVNARKNLVALINKIKEEKDLVYIYEQVNEWIRKGIINYPCSSRKE